MQVGIREFLPLPLREADLEDALKRAMGARKRLQPVEKRKGRIIVVTGHKGGAGTTTVAINLAEALGEEGTERVALVDLGRPFPDMGNFLDHEPNYSIIDLVQNIATLDTAFVQRIMEPFGTRLSILHGAADFRDQESMVLENLDRIFAILREMYRLIVVDLSHWLDELFVRVVTEADMVLLLSGFTIPDLRNLKKIWPHIREWQHDRRKIKIVVNRYDNSSALQLRDLENILKHPAFFTLPSDYATLMQCLNQGTSLLTTAPRSKIGRSFKEMAARILVEINSEENVAEVAAAPRKRFWLF